MRYDSLTYLEIKAKSQKEWLVILPTGCTEQQGPHLPVGFDTWLVENITFAASARAWKKYQVGSLVLPALPFGPTPEHRNFGFGYVHIPQDLHGRLVMSILNSMAEQGFNRIIIWRGCGGHNFDQVLQDFNTNNIGRAKVVQPALPYHDIWCRVGDPSIPGGHADSFSTSLALFLKPEMVREGLISNPKNTPVDWDDPKLDFDQYSSTGVIGDPTHASACLGEKLWESVVDEVAHTIWEIASHPKSDV
jgi:creatinine amidohydrolase